MMIPGAERSSSSSISSSTTSRTSFVFSTIDSLMNEIINQLRCSYSNEPTLNIRNENIRPKECLAFVSSFPAEDHTHGWSRGATSVRSYLVKGLWDVLESLETCRRQAGRAIMKGNDAEIVRIPAKLALLVDRPSSAYPEVTSLRARPRDSLKRLYNLDSARLGRQYTRTFGWEATHILPACQ